MQTSDSNEDQQQTFPAEQSEAEQSEAEQSEAEQSEEVAMTDIGNDSACGGRSTGHGNGPCLS